MCKKHFSLGLFMFLPVEKYVFITMRKYDCQVINQEFLDGGGVRTVLAHSVGFSRSKFMAEREFMGRACKNCDVGKTGLKPFGGLNCNRAQIVMIILQIKQSLGVAHWMR